MTSTIRPLAVERRGQQNETKEFAGGAAQLTPFVHENYWAYRVRLTDEQAIVAFPKFGTIGVGFAKEEDWNTNLPYTCHAPEIAEHIEHNAGDPAITRILIEDAVQLIKNAITADALKECSR